MTARRAYDILEAENPQVLASANKMLGALSSSYPELTLNESEHSFVECATFADFLKTLPGNPYGWQFYWHFINQAYVDEAGKTVKDFPEFTPPADDNVDALYNLSNFLKDTGDYKSSVYYQKISGVFPVLAD